MKNCWNLPILKSTRVLWQQKKSKKKNTLRDKIFAHLSQHRFIGRPKISHFLIDYLSSFSAFSVVFFRLRVNRDNQIIFFRKRKKSQYKFIVRSVDINECFEQT